MASSLVADRIVTTAGSVFSISDPNGDINPNTLEGFFAADTRFLSALQLTVDGRPPALLRSASLAHNISSFYLSTDRSHGGMRRGMSVVRDRVVSTGLHEDITILNHWSSQRRFTLQIRVDADFADLFEVRREEFSKAGTVTFDGSRGTELRLVYSRDIYRRETRIRFSREPKLTERSASFEVELEPRATWRVCVSVLPVGDRSPTPVECIADLIGDPFEPAPSRLAVPRREMPELSRVLTDPPKVDTAHAELSHAYERAITDLRSLVVEGEPGRYVLAAGLPWFMAVFGRDSIISAIQTKILGPDLMTGALYTLAGYQARETDAFREAQPGKIPHEVRQGELSVFSEVPHARYYGSVDSTPLFIMLLGEAYRWTGDEQLVRRLLPAAEEALEWLDQYGDADRDGFVEYETDSAQGLRNQCWKDSEDSISFADGTLADGPIAMAEVQGYVFRARLAAAEMFRVVGMDERADQQEQEAERLRRRFEECFWMPEEEFVALALDGRKEQVSSIASNAGHCLWTGILSEDKAAKVVDRLMAPDMFSGWGIRTLSRDMARYDPVSYHNGSVWPHDNSIIAAGFARYGFHTQAERVISALIDAAASFPEYRLPELFAGYPRRLMSFPVPYPSANAPQAWAAGSVVYGIETLLGLRIEGDTLHSTRPLMARPLAIRGLKYRGESWTF